MDEGQGLGQGDVISSTDASNSAQQAPATVSSPNERLLSQSEVNEIVGRAKKEAAETAVKRYTEYQKSNQQTSYNQAPSSPQHSSESEIRRLAAEEAHRLRDEWINDARSKSEQDQAQKIVQNFYDKISSGKQNYEDFDAITGDIEFARFPNVVQILAEHLDNSSDVLYELGKDRFKMAQLEQLSQMSPKDALVQAKRLSDSIKANRESGKVRQSNQPLSQIRPSNTGTDSGVMSVGDYRRKYRI